MNDRDDRDVSRWPADRSTPSGSHDDALLLEREPEQAALSRVVTGLCEKRPAVVNVAGRHGHGQNALLRWAARLAGERGLRVLAGRATPAERELRYGAVLQLLTPLGKAAEDTLLDLTERDGPGLIRTLPALWETPTLLIIEDAHWLDIESSAWLQALTRRLFTGIPIAVLTSTRDGLGAGSPGWISAIHATAVDTTELTLGPLTRDGVAAGVELVCGRPGDTRFIAAAAGATYGIPAVLRDVLAGFTGQAHRPVAEHIPELRSAAAHVLGDHASWVIGRLSGAGETLLRAIAVCGELLDFPLVFSLTGLRAAQETEVRDTLEAAGLVCRGGECGESVHIRFPVVRDRVLEDTPAVERVGLYARAAELAHRAAVGDDDLADLLLQAPPLAASWVVPTLRRASLAALERGAYDRSTACLARALQEPLGVHERAQLDLELAESEIVAASGAGDRRLAELARLRAGRADTAHTCVRSIDVGLARGDYGWARRASAEALAKAPDDVRDDLVALYWLASLDQDPGLDEGPMLPEVPALPDRPGSPAQAAVRAWELTLRGEDATTARRLARSALVTDSGHGPLMTRLAACQVLFLTDEVDAARAELDRLLAWLGRGHARVVTARALAVRAELHLRGARLDEAERDVAAAERALPPASWHPHAAHYLHFLRISVALHSARSEEAQALAAAPAADEADDSVTMAYLLVARGRVAALGHDWDGALDLARRAGNCLLRSGWTNPLLLPWRSLAAKCHLARGETGEAERLSREESVLAQRWGTAGATSLAALFAGVTGAEPVADIGRLTEVPTGSAERLAHAWALAELAAAELERGNRHIVARLLFGLTRFTASHPSSRLAQVVRQLAEQAGRPPQRRPPEAWTELTEPERETASLVGHGHSNREIAELLGVSRRTIELRLSSVYKKLHLAGRKELGALVGRMGGRETDAA